MKNQETNEAELHFWSRLRRNIVDIFHGDDMLHIRQRKLDDEYGIEVVKDEQNIYSTLNPNVQTKHSLRLGDNFDKLTDNVEMKLQDKDMEDSSNSNSDPTPAETTHRIIDDCSSYDNTSILFGDPPQRQSNRVTILVGFFVAVGGFLYGYDTGLINSIVDMQYVREHFSSNHDNFTAEQLAIIVSFLSLGTFFGALTAPVISDRCGRKTVIILSTLIIFLTGNTIQISSNGVVLLVIGRVISGFSVGLISAVVPLYQSEAAIKYLRGAIISTFQWAITWGLLVSSAVSQATYTIDKAASYRIPIGLQYIWACFLGIGMFFLPESPRYYVLKDKLDKAASSLSFLRRVPVHDSGLLEELVEIKATYDYEMSFGSSTLLDCFRSSKTRPKQTLRMFTGILLQVFQQFSGINFIFYYGVNFFSRTGIENSYRISLITYAVNVAFTIPGLFLVDRVGRRNLLLYGGIGMAISNFIIAIVSFADEHVINNRVMIAFICIFIVCFTSSWGIIVWVLSAELYPLGVRSKCVAICAASNWLVNFICAFITPYIVNITSHTYTIGPRIFFLWGALNAVGVVVVYFTVYETKGLTLEEIDELFSECPNSISSPKWNKKIRERKLAKRNQHNGGKMRDYYYENNATPNVLTSSILENESEFQNRKIKHIKDFDGTFAMSVSEGTTKMAQSCHERQGTMSSTTDFDEFATNTVDLGNGFALNPYSRGPPSIPTDSSDESDESNEPGRDTTAATNNNGINKNNKNNNNNNINNNNNNNNNKSNDDDDDDDDDNRNNNNNYNNIHINNLHDYSNYLGQEIDYTRSFESTTTNPNLSRATTANQSIFE
ncbi:hypothetical protein Kpol_1019p31 [Vanderwaltozyma polyspora DSM 70294]|uniref:Major facilitator superfamily (MFS) profile domain-containing protein n=1 Tax=Vanderwaltozyma polyspora (strain ATCC 22028 / DSM 70294 / BCRC 21397 / CBS 2163 / NBRC 10782 / NRRL Y-8283 / UCD 57-17) TaxID=436907 RepID=A7TPC3_VANPO|nr:uncharacterized protein Kpol_1019p31 [Vanderwaltozyma polyspora DSM 70294]EDO15910.1 hypothetical protein Kpol_1019p31 [Vanderwaltozyma polyspora DSM 70294]